MSKFGVFFLLFCDSFFGNLLLYPNSEYVVFAMNFLGYYNSTTTFTVVVSGFILSVQVNYFCGFIAKKIYVASMPESKMHNYNSMLTNFRKNGWIILLFNIIPLFGKFFPFLAGFVSFGPKKTLIFCLMSKALYYYYFIFL